MFSETANYHRATFRNYNFKRAPLSALKQFWVYIGLVSLYASEPIKVQSFLLLDLRSQISRIERRMTITTFSRYYLSVRTPLEILSNQSNKKYICKNIYSTSLVGYQHIPSFAFPSLRSQLHSIEQRTSEDRSRIQKSYFSKMVESTSVPLTLNHDKKHSLYENLIRKLYMTNLFHPVKLGLKNIEALHEALGSPMKNSKIVKIHVAGSNGKGSVTLKIAKVFELSGHRTGIFVSPHISSFRERMCVNNAPISENEVEHLLPKVFEACERNSIPATFFEVTTALAFLFFAEKKADVVVLETGLGGRLDATNVIEDPAISIITSIGLEHTRILGNTIEEIALEKGGIIKKNRPVLVGPNVPLEVLRNCAIEKNASAFYTCEDVLGELNEAEVKDIVKDYDKENSRIVKAALKILQDIEASKASADETNPFRISDDHVIEGTSIRPPCRFEKIYVSLDRHGDAIIQKKMDTIPTTKNDYLNWIPVVLDVAHNPSALEHLESKLRNTFPCTFRVVAGFSADKDLLLCGKSLLRLCQGDPTKIHLVEASHPRAAKVEDILDALPELKNPLNELKDRSITVQINTALKMASKSKNEVVVVCGSVFIMAEAREALGYNEPRDSEYIAEVAGCNLRHGQENFGNTLSNDKPNII